MTCNVFGGTLNLAQSITGILAYADVIALFAPTAHSMRRMLSICETYSAEFSISFNASKSKCVVCSSRCLPKELNFVCDVKFTINGNVIEVVQSLPQPGHIITTDMDNIRDIDRCRHKLVGQINNVLCSFHQVDSVVKIALLKSCLSVYGCELWHLQHPAIENICKSRQNGMRRVWDHLTVGLLLYRF